MRKVLAWVPIGYLAVATIAAIVAAVRLSESTEMPGLAAIELVLLALPWSWALTVRPVSTFALPGMTLVVLAGVAINVILLWWISNSIRIRLRAR
jgi:hypothetical protein